nr:hypothetical protein CFP56_09297 [Quercus suber]
MTVFLLKSSGPALTISNTNSTKMNNTASRRCTGSAPGFGGRYRLEAHCFTLNCEDSKGLRYTADNPRSWLAAVAASEKRRSSVGKRAQAYPCEVGQPRDHWYHCPAKSLHSACERNGRGLCHLIEDDTTAYVIMKSMQSGDLAEGGIRVSILRFERCRRTPRE